MGIQIMNDLFVGRVEKGCGQLGEGERGDAT